MNIVQAIYDKNLFRPFLGNVKSWQNWITSLKVIYGLPTSKAQVTRSLIKQCTGRDTVDGGFSTALFLTGRRSGKSRIAACIAAYEAILSGSASRLSAGESGVVLVVSPTRSQSRIVKDYCRALFEVPLLAAEIASETQDGFELNNGVRITVLAGDWRSVRGFTLLACIIDEAAFFGYSDESKVKSDTELIRAIQPSLATTGGKLIAISSPYAMKGWCYQQHKRHFGNNAGSTLVWNCPSRTMNKTLPQSIIDNAMAEDPASARAEYLGQFRDDVATFLPRDVIEACVVKGRKELPPVRDRRYAAFVDLSGGRNDDASLCIAHQDDRSVVVDCLRCYRPPFSPDQIIAEMVYDLRRYGVRRVVGDNYSAEFTKSAFEVRGIQYRRATTNVWSSKNTTQTTKSRSMLYLELLPRLCSGEIELLDNEQLITQLAGLERRTRAGGRDIVDHGPGGHDDVANAVAGVCDVLSQRVSFAGGPSFDRPRSAFEQATARFNETAAHEARIAAGSSQDNGDLPQMLAALRDPRFRF